MLLISLFFPLMYFLLIQCKSHNDNNSFTNTLKFLSLQVLLLLLHIFKYSQLPCIFKQSVLFLPLTSPLVTSLSCFSPYSQISRSLFLTPFPFSHSFSIHCSLYPTPQQITRTSLTKVTREFHVDKDNGHLPV